MEETKTPEVTETAEIIGTDERLKALAEKSGKSVEELLTDLEEKQTALDANTAVTNQSVGPQSKNTQEFFDPAGTEFLKGLWGK